MGLTRVVLVIASLISLGACEKPLGPHDESRFLISTQGRFERATTAGNLMATAIQDRHHLDFVFYPTNFLQAESYAVIEKGMDAATVVSRILPLFPQGDKDYFQIGTMKGSAIRSFLLQRTLENYRLDLEVAGLEYQLTSSGGLPAIFSVERQRGLKLEDDRLYRVAISDYYYFNPDTFPGYRYRNGLESRFEREPDLISAREALSQFLTGHRPWFDLDEDRATFVKVARGEQADLLSIAQIQGRSHISPYYGYKVKTQGIITAIAKRSDATTEFYLQSEFEDGDPVTSEALNVYLEDFRGDLAVGQLVEVRGTVYELVTNEGLTRTAIREITGLSILSSGRELPQAKRIGSGRLTVPKQKISTYRGNVNQKEELNLNDGLDFWESLEGMRIQVAKPRVVGFRGGLDTFADNKQYLTVYVTPDGVHSGQEWNAMGGLFYDPRFGGDNNPEILRLPLSELAPQIKANQVFQIGDQFAYDLEGILSFETNTFGNGEFVMYVTGNFSATSQIRDLEDRPQTTLIPDDNHLSIVSFNVENLPGNQIERLKRLGQAIYINMKCPDILTIPELQDNNGINFAGGSSADQTLQILIRNIPCPGADYRAVNIDPVPNQDGGEPGGNIRVVFLYNAKRVGFQARGAAGPLDETMITESGDLNHNPGRLFPGEPLFRRTRKPLIAAFEFKGKTVFVIGNHLNSKLGDASHWAASQPAVSNSENLRIRLARRIHDFVEVLQKRNPEAHIIVAGDFNAYHFEPSMQVMAGDVLTNLMTYGNLLSPDRWFTTNFDGNATAIDFIFVNNKLLERQPEIEILHLNSPYMGKLSDHDPVVARFAF